MYYIRPNSHDSCVLLHLLMSAVRSSKVMNNEPVGKVVVQLFICTVTSHVTLKNNYLWASLSLIPQLQILG